jgi:DNA-binding phage protein
MPAEMKAMIEHFTRWDSADHLKTEADRAEYLGVCMEAAGSDSGFIAKALGVITRSRSRDRLLNDTNGVPERGL